MTEYLEFLQFGSAGAVIVVVMLFLKFLKEERKSWNETVKGTIEANNAIMKQVLIQLGKSEGISG